MAFGSVMQMPATYPPWAIKGGKGGSLSDNYGGRYVVGGYRDAAGNWYESPCHHSFTFFIHFFLQYS